VKLRPVTFYGDLQFAKLIALEVSFDVTKSPKNPEADYRRHGT
jgi:hypothetical protein